MLSKIKNLKPFVEKSAYPKVKLFSWYELERLINLRPLLNASRFKILSGKEYTWEVGPWISDPNTFPPSLVSEEIKHHVCCIEDCSRANEKLNQVCKDLEEGTGWACDAHIFFSLSVNDKEGFGVHYDTSHNFIVQCEGQNLLQVWADTTEGCPTRIDKEPKDLIIEEVLNPGDAIFIPNNTWHRSTALTPRISVSFPLWPHGGLPQDRHWIYLDR